MMRRVTSRCLRRNAAGFTLAELLIALAILGVIATFTIPKILVVQQNQQYKAEAKEVAAMLSAATQQYSLNEGLTGATLTQSIMDKYLNYVAIDTTSTVDRYQSTASTTSCSSWRCYKLHNGGILHFQPIVSFGGTAATNAVYAYFDPDAKVSSNKSILFYIYYDGRVTSRDSIKAGTCDSGSCYNADPAAIPPWFSWD